MIREGSGAGHGIDMDLGQAHESALKEAETDAMKRALMTFGNPFGLALYDKQQRQVSNSPGQGDRPQRSAEQRPPVSRPAPSTPHHPASSPPALAGEPHPRAFRKRFQVPEEATTIADRISQKFHHDWIGAFLVQQQSTTTD